MYIHLNECIYIFHFVLADSRTFDIFQDYLRKILCSKADSQTSQNLRYEYCIMANSGSVHLNVHSKVYIFGCTNSECAIRIYYGKFRICIHIIRSLKNFNTFSSMNLNHFMIGFISATNNKMVAKLLSLLNVTIYSMSNRNSEMHRRKNVTTFQ